MNPSNLPEQYRRYADVVGEQPLTGKVELYAERGSVVWVPDAYGRMVPMPKHHAPPPVLATEPRDLRPQPLFDPVAQRWVGAGVGSGIALWGGGQFLAGASQFVSGLSGMGALLFFLAVAGARAVIGGRSGAYVRNEQHTHVHQKWFGRTGITNNQ
ncbi:hypothetical protein [Streptomyces sp. NPDC127108]|uniref:hypothetical protein n=1 Tax=Streptomyces sp. NPDC127108 TaxID=3345361 RepID=UPI00363267BF